MNDEPLVSVVMPAYNAERTIAEAIRSVLAQTWTNWELVVVDDGSTDGTWNVIASFTDTRIRPIRQSNTGIGGARNIALDLVRGDFMCMLDSDDVLPPDSIRARAELLMRRPEVDFCDGRVTLKDEHLVHVLRRYEPSFRGAPFKELIKLTGSCFFGVTWMVRYGPHRDVRFDARISHAEDLLFYLEMSRQRGLYDHVDTEVLLCRRTPGSSMSNLEGLERSYHYLLDWLEARPSLTTASERMHFRRRIRRIMAGSYWHAGRKWKALQAALFRPSDVQPQSAANTSA